MIVQSKINHNFSNYNNPSKKQVSFRAIPAEIIHATDTMTKTGSCQKFAALTLGYVFRQIEKTFPDLSFNFKLGEPNTNMPKKLKDHVLTPDGKTVGDYDNYLNTVKLGKKTIGQKLKEMFENLGLTEPGVVEINKLKH